VKEWLKSSKSLKWLMVKICAELPKLSHIQNWVSVFGPPCKTWGREKIRKYGMIK